MPVSNCFSNFLERFWVCTDLVGFDFKLFYVSFKKNKYASLLKPFRQVEGTVTLLEPSGEAD